MAYYIEVVCGNCGWEGTVEIGDGELVESQKCPVCKCRKIVKRTGASGRRIHL